jgi:multiple sugar transport system substrate-binding protein
MPEAARKKKVGDTTDPWGDGLESIGNIWMYSMHDDVFKMVKNKKMDIDIYPMPKAPEGGTTSLHAYYDTLSLSSALAKDPVKAEAAYQLLKWLTYGGEGLRSRWSLVYEILGRPGDDPLKEKVLTKMVDWTLGWPVTTNPDVLKDNPFVKGFPEGSEAAALYNFPAFKNTDFQQMLSNPVPFPRNLPAVANVYDTFSSWKIRDEILKEGRKYSDIASGWDENLNKSLDNYLREYNKK